MIANSETPLLEFFERVFLPDRLVGKNQRYVDTYPRAIEWLALTLEHEPTIADLTAPNIRRTMRMVRDCGNKFYWIAKMRTRLCSIWKHAQRIGIVNNYEQVAFLQTGEKNTFLEQPPADGTLRKFYMREYRPRLNKAVRADSDAAVRRLDKYHGAYVLLDDIDTELLVRLGEWLAKQGISQSRIGRYQCTVRCIVRAWDPTRFPKRAANANQELPAPAPGTVRHFFETVYLPQRMLDASPEGVYQATLAVRRLWTHYGRDVRLNELTDSLAAEHFAWLKHDQGLLPVSVNTAHRATLFAIWRYAAEMGLVDRDPRVRKLKQTTHEPDSWDPGEFRRLVEATSIFAGRTWRGRVPLDKFWRAALLVEAWTAIRRKSLFSIRRADVNLETRWIYIRPDCAKNRHGKKYRIGEDAAAAIEAIWQPSRELLFEWPYRPEAQWRHFRAIQRAAGLAESHLATGRFHKLRRTVAAQVAVLAGLPAATALLDHSGADVTRRYIDPAKMPGTDMTAILPGLFTEGDDSNEENAP